MHFYQHVLSGSTTSAATLQHLSLYEFFIFNAKFAGKKEGEEFTKILYFYPPHVSENEQCMSMGLSEAITSFTSSFSDSHDCVEPAVCEALICDNRRHVFLEVEPGYWMTMVVNIDAKAKHHEKVSKEQLQTQLQRQATGVRPLVSVPKEEKQDAITYYDDISDTYCDSNLPYCILQTILQQSYTTFRTSNGTMEQIFKKNNNNVQVLRAKLKTFFDQYIESMNSFNAQDPYNIFDICDGLEFLPVDPSIFLKVHSFVNHTIDIIGSSMIHGAIFLYDDQLIFSGVTHEEARIIKRYMGIILEERYRLSNSKIADMRFLTGPDDIHSARTTYAAPTAYINNGELECYVIAYKYRNVVIHFLVSKNLLTNHTFYEKLESLILQKLQKLHKQISEKLFQINSFNDTFKYIYFNRMNLAIKTSLKKRGNTSIIRELLAIVSQIHNDFVKNYSGLKEVFLRVRRDAWVVGKLFGEREYYILFDQKNYSLMEVHEQVQKISNIFFSTANK